jgi:DNA-directed RNA polymerase specialized sigma24 family protein
MSRTPNPRPVSVEPHYDIVEDWLEQSRSGDTQSRDKMLIWVHRTAVDYFCSKVSTEPLFSLADAWDLASDSVVEFERSWTRVRRVSHYCRRMYKNNLNRYLHRKRKQMLREQALDHEGTQGREAAISVMIPRFDFELHSDEEKAKIATARAELERADDTLRSLFEYRVFSGQLTYAQIGALLGASETSLRMRMTRFNKRVKNRHAQAVRRRLRDRRPLVSRLDNHRQQSGSGREVA